MEYKLKQIPEDFIVHEVPLLPSLKETGTSAYTYFYVEKMGYTTFEMQEILAVRFQISLDDVSFHGLKDEDGITVQLFSVKKIILGGDHAKVEGDGSKKYYKITSVYGYGDDPLKSKSLHGNSFIVTIRDMGIADAEKVLERCKDKTLSFINYYDEQRFGKPDSPHNTHLIGKALVDMDYETAKEEYIRSTNEIPALGSENIATIGGKEFFEALPQNFLSFIISSYNSFLWNKCASKEIAETAKCEGVCFPNVGELNIPIKRSFVSESSCVCDGYKIADGLEISNKKADRPLVTSTSMYVNTVEPDELNPGRKKIELAFFLPTGSYATMAIKQLMIQAECRTHSPVS